MTLTKKKKTSETKFFFFVFRRFDESRYSGITQLLLNSKETFFLSTSKEKSTLFSATCDFFICLLCRDPS